MCSWEYFDKRGRYVLVTDSLQFAGIMYSLGGKINDNKNHTVGL